MAQDILGKVGENNPLKKGFEDMAKKFGGAKGGKNPLEMLFQK